MRWQSEFRLKHIVSREEDRFIFGLQIADDLPQFAGPDRVQTDGRFVEEQDLRIVQQSSGNVEPLLHPP